MNDLTVEIISIKLRQSSFRSGRILLISSSVTAPCIKINFQAVVSLIFVLLHMVKPNSKEIFNTIIFLKTTSQWNVAIRSRVSIASSKNNKNLMKIKAWHSKIKNKLIPTFRPLLHPPSSAFFLPKSRAKTKKNQLVCLSLWSMGKKPDPKIYSAWYTEKEDASRKKRYPVG